MEAHKDKLMDFSGFESQDWTKDPMIRAIIQMSGISEAQMRREFEPFIRTVTKGDQELTLEDFRSALVLYLETTFAESLGSGEASFLH